MNKIHLKKFFISLVIIGILAIVGYMAKEYPKTDSPVSPVDLIVSPTTSSTPALKALATLAIKGRAPKTDYTRAQFGGDWATINGCSERDTILKRDLSNITIGNDCHVLNGVLHDPYTRKTIAFTRGVETSGLVQIDHVVALSDAWQTGAQQFTQTQRITFANDPLELLAVDGATNEQKSDGDAATWLPPNKSYRCTYVARQIAIKAKYVLWVTQAEHEAMQTILSTCPSAVLPSS